jgi:hypothetical protein
VQYESNLSTNCSNTDLVALVISFFFFCQYIDKEEQKKREFFVIFRRKKKKRRRGRIEYEYIKEREKKANYII